MGFRVFKNTRIVSLTPRPRQGYIPDRQAYGFDTNFQRIKRLLSRGALPEVDRSHPSGSLFLYPSVKRLPETLHPPVTFQAPVPASSSPKRGQYVSTVIANVPLCREHFRLALTIDAFPPTKPGQFVQVACADDVESDVEREWSWDDSAGARPVGPCGSELIARTAVLRRPFSLAGRRDTPGGVELDLIHRVVGVGTDWLSRLNVGDPVNVIGPLGNTFTLPEPGGQALLVGGGVGIPPMIYLASALGPDRKGVAFCGALTRDLLALTVTDQGAGDPDAVAGLLNVDEFARHGIPTVVTTDDGSYGYRGFVTQALERYLDARARSGAPFDKTIVYTCGPEPMMKRVADIARSRGIRSQIAVERAMACGMGTCQSCVIKVKTGPTTDAWRYKLACTDGPVFAGNDLLW
jgi:dihydroorotate dehydrogenase electron transfer subunit